MESVNILWNLFRERTDHARQHANQRATVTNYFLAIASALLAFAADDGLQLSDLPITIFMIVIGVYGGLFSKKHYLENRRHSYYAKKYKERISQYLEADGIDLVDIERQALEDFLLNHKQFKRGVLNRYWKGINTIIWVLGVVLTLIIVITSLL